MKGSAGVTHNMSPQMRAPDRGRGNGSSGKGYKALGAHQHYEISVQGIDP